MRQLACVICIWLVALDVCADEFQARELFSAGVQALLERNWSEGVRLLEASLAHKDKPACRFNLIVANRELHRPLEVARHAVAFLETVEGRSHPEEAAAVRRFLTDAVGELVTLQIGGLPLGAQLKIDGAPPEVTDGSRIYALPGLHRLELWLGERQLEAVEIGLGAGTLQSWPRVRAASEHAPAAASAERALAGDAPRSTIARPAGRAQAHAVKEPGRATHALLSAPTKKKLAWTLGVTGAVTGLSAVGSFGYAANQADELESWDPGEPGYTNAADRYRRAKASVMPLAFAGGALMVSATTLVARRPRAALYVSIAAFGAGLAAASVGTVLMLRTPNTLVDDTELASPSREGGSLLLGAALPLLAHGARLQWDVWRIRNPRRH